MDEFWKLVIPSLPALVGIFVLYLNQRRQAHQIELNKAGIVVKSDEVEVGKDVLVLDMAREHKKLLEEFRLFQLDAKDKEVAALLREREQTKDFNAQIVSLQQQLKAKDEALEILKRLEPKVDSARASSTLANQQLTHLQHTIAVNNQPDDTAKADSERAANVIKDDNADKGQAPTAPTEATSTAPLMPGDTVVLSVPTEGTTP